MFLQVTYLPHHARGFPRVRGDVPIMANRNSSMLTFSPRARGCSFGQENFRAVVVVFPACAGMFPIIMFEQVKHLSFPRVRGDVPLLP